MAKDLSFNVISFQVIIEIMLHGKRTVLDTLGQILSCIVAVYAPLAV